MSTKPKGSDPQHTATRVLVSPTFLALQRELAKAPPKRSLGSWFVDYKTFAVRHDDYHQTELDLYIESED